MVADAVKVTNMAIEQGATLPKVGKYGDLMTMLNNQEVPVDDVTRIQSQILSNYARYIRMENQEDERKKQGGTDIGGYYDDQKKEYAIQIKNALNALKQGKVRY